MKNPLSKSKSYFFSSRFGKILWVKETLNDWARCHI
jgi:hypothetical protein